MYILSYFSDTNIRIDRIDNLYSLTRTKTCVIHCQFHIHLVLHIYIVYLVIALVNHFVHCNNLLYTIIYSRQLAT